MELTTVLTTLLTFFATPSEDLCKDVYLNPAGLPITDVLGQTFSRYCAWSGPDVPVWDDDVCCTFDDDGAQCTTPDDKGRCSTGEQRRYCEYGETVAAGVVCYQPFEDMCDHGLCVAPPEEPPPVVANLACCFGGNCFPIVTKEMEDCDEAEGMVMWCFHGATNTDGTITCYD